MTTFSTPLNGNRLDLSADQPGNVATPQDQVSPAEPVLLPEITCPNHEPNGHPGANAEPTEDCTVDVEIRHLTPRRERFYLYVVAVPKSWEFQSFKSTPPDTFNAMEYSSAAECTAAINRSYLIREQREGREPTTARHWNICIQKNHGFSFVRVFVPKGWQPVDEYDLPPGAIEADFNKSELRRQLKAINAIVSQHTPRKGARDWVFAGWPIRPDEVHERSERHYSVLNRPYRFNVITDNGAVLSMNQLREEALAIATQHNAMNPQPEHRAKIVQAN